MNFLKKEKFLIITSFFLVFTIFTSLLTYPLIPLSQNHFFETGDTQLVNWIFSWEYHAITHQLKNVFDANIFYPHKLTLTYTENLFGVLPIFSFFYYLTNNNIFATNMVLISSFIFSGVFMSWLVYYLINNYLIAIIAGFIFAFSPFRFSHLEHIHILNFYWFPLIILFLLKYLKTGKKINLVFYSLFLFLLVASSLNLGIIGLIGICGFLLPFLVKFLTVPQIRQKIAYSLIASLISLLLYLPILNKYFLLNRNELLMPSAIHGAAYSADLFKSYLNIWDQSKNLIYLDKLGRFKSLEENQEKTLFPGFLPLFLGIAALFLIKKRKLLPWLFIGLAGFLFSLGPKFIINERIIRFPLPYYFFRFIPGFEHFRTPARCATLVIFSLSILSAFSLDKIKKIVQKQAPQRRNIFLLFSSALIILFWEFNSAPLELKKVVVDQEITDNAAWLKNQSLSPILELPIGKRDNNQREWVYNQTEYMFYSTYHWQPLVNGYSGAFPKDFSDTLAKAEELPDKNAFDYFKDLGVKYYLVHFNKLENSQIAEWKEAENKGIIKKIRGVRNIIYEANN